MAEEQSVEVGLVALTSAEGGAIAKLEPEQQRALRYLVEGSSVAETARSMGVARSTIHRWIKNDATFRAAYEEWQEEALASVRSRLLALTDRATDSIEQSVKAGNSAVSMQVLKSLGCFGGKKEKGT
jgi:transposase-like protein